MALEQGRIDETDSSIPKLREMCIAGPLPVKYPVVALANRIHAFSSTELVVRQ